MFVTAELAPLAQSGGLGDAAAGLARALGAQGHEVTCVVPGYQSALRKSACPTLVDGGRVQIAYPNVTAHGRFLVGELFPNVEVCLLDLPELFGRDGLYGDRHGEFGDNAFRFLTFCRAAAYRAETELPDVVVAHDWHAGLVPVLMRTSLDRGALRGVGAVQVVHNNAYQGRIPAQLMPYTHLAPDLFHADGLEAWGTLCMLKGGLMWADRIVAVSPTYAREVQTSSFGEGLEGAYRSRSHRLSGIVNGIDAARFDPSTDQALPAPYSARDPSGKALCRRALLDRLGLDVPPPGLLVAAIGRLAPQKGWDVLAAAVDGLLELGATLVLLGDGDPWIAGLLESKQRQHSRRQGFLPDVCQAWEAAAATAQAFARVVHLRIGVVLSPQSGALSMMLPAFQTGAGGPLGPGTQFMSLISIDDMGAVVARAVLDDRVQGPVNAVGPTPLSNREFSQTLGRVLSRPSVVPVPAFALRALFGDLADEGLLASARVVPKRLLDLGHSFRHDDVDGALRHVLGRAAVRNA